MSEPQLYLLTPPRGNYLSLLPDLFKAGVDLVQFRRPRLSDRAALAELKSLLKITRNHSIPVFVNDRPDLALLTGAQGVHLGAEDVDPRMVKQHWPNLQVGLTQRFDEPLLEPADYYGVGPVFSPLSKKLDTEPCGWSGVARLLDRTSLPVYAIGGITYDNINDYPDGLTGVALISGIWSADNPVRAAARIKRALEN